MSEEVEGGSVGDVPYIRGVVLAMRAEKPGGWQQPEETRLLERLKYSGLQYALLYHATQGTVGTPPQGENLLSWEEGSPLGPVLERVAGQWSLPRSAVVVVLGGTQEKSVEVLSRDSWPLILLPSSGAGVAEGGSARTSFASSHADATLAHMGELPAAIANINKKRSGPAKGPVVVAYTMKWERERSLLERLALPWAPNPQGLCFLPLDLARPLGPQMDPVDALLHKATDEIIALPARAEGTPRASVMDRFGFSPGFEALLRYVKERPGICVIDPIEKIRPILDRHAMQAALTGLSQMMTPGSHVAVRAPRSAEVSSFEAAEVDNAMEQSGVPLPAIVKPQVACGAAESHTMAVVLRREGFAGLKVPTPAVIQEYVDHGCLQHKVYAVGGTVFVSQRRSTPNALSLAVNSLGGSGPSAIVFDSLRSLPTSFEGRGEGGPSQATRAAGGSAPLDAGAVEAAAEWLRKALGLTIIGFDIVIQEGSGDHVVVDVNYFPSFKDVPNEKALPAFWNALLRTYAAHVRSHVSG